MTNRNAAVLEATDLTLAWGPEVLLVCRDLVLPGGTVTWIEGASGAGKSSLLRALARLVPMVRGELRLRGSPASGIAPHLWRSRVLLVTSPPVALGDSLRDALLAPYRLRAFRARPIPSDQVLIRELSALGLGGLTLDKPASRLSQGQLARVAFLRAVLAEPELLLLDEPTANLDPASGEALAERASSFAGEGRGVFVAGHGSPWPQVDRRYRIAGGELREAVP